MKGVWRELVRPRGPQRHRFHRVGRRSHAGVALLMVITSILLLTILVAEISRDDATPESVMFAATHNTEDLAS